MKLAELKSNLRVILAAEEMAQTDWKEVQALCLQTTERLTQGPVPDFPHDIWHFLADADIRQKDTQYGEEQRRELRTWLADPD